MLLDDFVLRIPKDATYNDKKIYYNQFFAVVEYKLAQMVFTEFECKTFKDYHDLYLTTDVTLLCDVFENKKFGQVLV